MFVEAACSLLVEQLKWLNHGSPHINAHNNNLHSLMEKVKCDFPKRLTKIYYIFYVLYIIFFRWERKVTLTNCVTFDTCWLIVALVSHAGLFYKASLEIIEILVEQFVKLSLLPFVYFEDSYKMESSILLSDMLRIFYYTMFLDKYVYPL